MAEPGKEIEIATSKLTTMCLKYWWFQPERAYKAVAYKKKKVYTQRHDLYDLVVTKDKDFKSHTVYALPGIGLDLVYVGYDSTIGILKTFRYIFVLRNLFGCTEAYVLAYTYGKEFESYFF